MLRGIWLREYLRIAIVLLVALLLGWLTGYYAGFLLFGLSAYLIVHLLNLYRLQQWLASRRAYPPDANGIWGEVFQEYYRMQRRNHQRKRRLAQLLREFRTSTAAMPDGVVVMDKTWRILWLNDAAEQLLGLAARDVGQRIDNLVRPPAFTNYLAGGDWKEPLDMPALQDQERRLNLHVVSYGEGQRLLLVRDTTRLYRLERMRREFVANASHELRSPLTVISGYLEAMQDDPLLGKQWRQAMDETQRQTARMTGIVNDLLELARLETADGDAERYTIEVSELAGRIRNAALAQGDGSRDIQLEIDPDMQLAGNERDIYSAFSNLVFNAMRYTPADGHVILRWYRHEGQTCFAVSDTGIGIATEHLPRLTERFYRVDQARTRSKGGTGLGLAIVKHVMQRHGGRLHITSTPGEGSTFTCVFPADRII